MWRYDLSERKIIPSCSLTSSLNTNNFFLQFNLTLLMYHP